MDYKSIADQIITAIGGKDNVQYVTHCVTRLRFVVKDKQLVNQTEVNDIEGVMGSTFGAGQFQIIMGKHLSDTFTEVVNHYQFEVGAILEEHLDDPMEAEVQKPWWRRGVMEAFNFLAASVTPVIPGLTVAGLIKVFLVLISLAWPSAVNDQTYIVVNSIVNTSFYFMPVFVAYGASMRLGSTPIYAMIVACLLIHPDIIGLLKGEQGLQIFGMTAFPANYASSFLPGILSTIAVAMIEKNLNKYLPSMFKGIFVGGITLVTASLLTLTLIGPIGFFAGEYFINLLVWLQSTIGPFALGALGGVLPFVIMSGMHTVFGPVMMQSITSLGYEGFLRPTQFVHNVAEGGACFGVALKTKNHELRSQAISSGISAILAGVSEPAIYGINLRLKKPMYGVMAGGAIGGCLAGFFGVKAFAYGNPSILALPIYGETIVGILIAIAAAFTVSCTVSFFSGFEDIPTKITPSDDKQPALHQKQV